MIVWDEGDVMERGVKENLEKEKKSENRQTRTSGATVNLSEMSV